MLYIPVANTAKVALDLVMGANAVAQTLYFLKGAGWTQTALEDLGGSVLSWFSSNILPYLHSTSALRGAQVTDLTTDSAPSVYVAHTSLEAGGVSTGSPLPGNATMVITFRTAQRGRSARGRNYIIGLPATETNGLDRMMTTWVSNILDGYADLSVVETGTSTTHVVVSRFHNKVPRSSGVTIEINEYTCDGVIDSQRRRLTGRGD